jgi:hypothetical protein
VKAPRCSPGGRGTAVSVWFLKVPEPKVAKNRVHLDVYGDVVTLVERGASVQAVLEHWTVMTDPEANEFCVFERTGQ